jgi:ATP-binding cassette, subfamily B, bacterial MsbA
MTTDNQNENRLLHYVKPFIVRFISALAFMALVAFFTVLLPVVLEPLINELSIRSGGNLSSEALQVREFIFNTLGVDQSQLVSLLPLFLLVVFFGQAIFNFLSLYFMKTLGLKVVRNIRDQLYRNLVYQSVDFLSKAKSGDLTSRISNDIEKIRFAVSENLAVYIRETLTLIGFIIYVFSRDFSMALISMIILPVASVPLVYFARKVKKRGVQSQETIGELSNFLAETVAGNKIVKAYNMEEYEIGKFKEMNNTHYRINSRIALIYSLSAPIMQLIGGVVAFAVFSVGTHRIATGDIDPGKFTAFFLSILMMYTPIKKLSQAHNDYMQGLAGFQRVMQVVNTVNPIKDTPEAETLEVVQGEVEFKDVGFAYNSDQPVIRNVSFKAQPGNMIALVGASGSGKSTLMNLLLRFYEAEAGEIKIDDQNIMSVTLKSLRESISLVTQDVFIFNDTIENNITYGSKNFTSEDVKQASSIARAAEFIDKLPQTYQTLAGERGAFLSTGQRQRISIARAILKKPAILIFDEATSSLDSESEKLIQEAMVDVMKGRTTFVIAHRLSTIIEADQILVIENGEIKESGSHQELLVKRGLYYSLYNLQFPEMDIIM